MVGELLKLLTNQIDEVSQIKSIETKNSLGGRKIVMKKLIPVKFIGKIPYKFKVKTEVVWNPYKEHIDKSLYTYRELGRKNQSLTDLFIVLKNEIKENDIHNNVSSIRFERVIPCGSKELKNLKELVKNYYTN